MMAAALRGELLSRPLVIPTQTQGDAQKRRLEDRVERLFAEIAKLRDVKKEVVGRYQQAKKENKKLQRELNALKEDHAKEVHKLADQVFREFPDTEEGRTI
ncbi:UNVERIFIED_CONTAM: hypothetical protein Slati_3520000 [Sesamum latifolium]|uniref:Uncharacterized protein n=1 Tax=Sesamum latifolium TaxID=2727402 RepID=A0AAW2ULJ2_9LAMI